MMVGERKVAQPGQRSLWYEPEVYRKDQGRRMRLDLCGDWLLYDSEGREYAATVPGCVHTDVIKEDMYWRDNSLKCRWIENCDWTYVRNFEVESIRQGTFLVFEGLDTYCDIYLNDQKIGHCENMFIPHRIPVDGVLRCGENRLTVAFYSPVRHTAEKAERQGAYDLKRMYTRRQQCTYGWDWLDRFVTCGICRPVYLETDDAFGVEDLYIYTDQLDAYGAGVRVSGTYKNYTVGATVRIKVLSPAGQEVFGKDIYVNTADFAEYITIPDPQLWYPAGYGAHPLYTLQMIWEGGKYSLQFGIRTVRILEIEDEKGSSFYRKCLEIKKTPSALEYDQNEEFRGFILLVNGVKILCMGANYVPVEPFVSEETPEKMTAMLERAASCGLNMVRVWGGGVFEQEHFYNECDRLGLMVVQDFMMACGQYPEDEEWFIEQLALETEYAARLLRNHPCLMWWHGNNENGVLGCDTDEDYWSRKSAYRSMLPVLNRLDYTRRFLPCSPYGGNKFASKTVGTTHNTQYLSHWFDYIESSDMKNYQEELETYIGRFISEDAVFGAVSKGSLLKMMTEEEIYAEDMEMWYHHTKNLPNGGRLLDRYLNFARKVLGEFTDGEDRLFKMQYLQYEMIRITMENCRKSGWFCSGMIYWMLNDCWPASAGWALIDYYNSPKSGYYSFKRAAKQVISSVNKEGVIVSNVGRESKRMRLKCRRIDYRTDTETVLLEQEIVAAANECTAVKFSDPVENSRVSVEKNHIFVCDLLVGGMLYDRSFYKDGYLHMEPAAADAITLERICEDTFRITAKEYVQAVELTAKGTWYFEDNWFSMTKGESRLLKISERDGSTGTEKVVSLKATAYRLQ